MVANPWKYFEFLFLLFGGSVALEVTFSPPTARVPSSPLGHSTWDTWWAKRSLGRFFYRGFSRFPLLQISLHHFSTLISFHFIPSVPVMVRHAWSAGTLAIYRSSIKRPTHSHFSTRPFVGHEFRIYLFVRPLDHLCGIVLSMAYIFQRSWIRFPAITYNYKV